MILTFCRRSVVVFIFNNLRMGRGSSLVKAGPWCYARSRAGIKYFMRAGALGKMKG